MVLELTKDEFIRLQKQYKSTKKRSYSIGTRCSPERELEILAAIKQDRSFRSIKSEYHTSEVTIARIRRENGMWGV